MKASKKNIKAKDFDEAFEQGKDIVPYLDLASAKARYPVQRINIDIPQDILQKVDEEASRVGVPRTSLIKMWIAERTDDLKKSA